MVAFLSKKYAGIVVGIEAVSKEDLDLVITIIACIVGCLLTHNMTHWLNPAELIFTFGIFFISILQD